MAAVIEIEGVFARIEGGRWSSDDKLTRELLEAASRLNEVRAGGDDANPDLQVAQRAIAFLGRGRLVSYDELDDDDPPGLVY